MPTQSIDLSAVTEANFNGSAVEQINLNGAGVWTKPVVGPLLAVQPYNSTTLTTANNIYLSLPNRFDNFVRAYSGGAYFDLLKAGGYNPTGEALANINGELVVGYSDTTQPLNVGYGSNEGGLYPSSAIVTAKIPSGYAPFYNVGSNAHTYVMDHQGAGTGAPITAGCYKETLAGPTNQSFFPIAKVTNNGFVPYGSVSSVNHSWNGPVVAGQYGDTQRRVRYKFNVTANTVNFQVYYGNGGTNTEGFASVDASWNGSSVYHGDNGKYVQFTWSNGNLGWQRQHAGWNGKSFACPASPSNVLFHIEG